MRRNAETEYEEEVARDTVLMMIGGELMEITGGEDDDPEVRRQQ